MVSRPLLLTLAGLAIALGSCTTPRASTPSRAPYVLVLGTAQDAGLPQIGCRAACCTRARARPDARRLVTSLLAADPVSGGRWLLDATPDIREQMERAAGHPPGRRLPGPRPPLVDGVFLTHAHMGHYTGLAQLGPEAYSVRRLPVYGTRRMIDFLSVHEPWALLVRQGHLVPTLLDPGETLPLVGPAAGDDAPTLSVTAVSVPHRDEITDTVAFLVQGPRRSLLYLPDIDKWERWDVPLEDLLGRVDVALLDGTFHADGEVPGRSLADIPHPFVSETVQRLADQPAAVRAKVFFTHLNHTNPLADPDGPAARALRAAGFQVAEEGQVFEL